MKSIPLAGLSLKPFTTFDKDWFLLSAGDFASGKWNCMTISWGFLGTMWNKPVAQVVVRPQRYTREFMDGFDTFTISQFPASCRKALSILGSRSGRDGDKVGDAGLTPIASSKVAAPTFAEATLALECRILFRQQMSKDAFVEKSILNDCYPADDRHVIYIGEVLNASSN